MLDLFTSPGDYPANILPFDGIASYYGKVLSTADASAYFQVLFDEIEWKNDEAMIMGKHIITKRKVAWYADTNFEYTYSKITKRALLWHPALLKLKSIVELKTGDTYNSCLLNLYHTGQEGMAWHSDAEKDLKPQGAIASLTLGAERKFSFKHKQSKQTVSIVLENGSVLVMKGATQTHWLHRLPPTTKTLQPRINLTFRTILK